MKHRQLKVLYATIAIFVGIAVLIGLAVSYPMELIYTCAALATLALSYGFADLIVEDDREVK